MSEYRKISKTSPGAFFPFLEPLNGLLLRWASFQDGLIFEIAFVKSTMRWEAKIENHRRHFSMKLALLLKSLTYN